MWLPGWLPSWLRMVKSIKELKSTKVAPEATGSKAEEALAGRSLSIKQTKSSKSSKVAPEATDSKAEEVLAGRSLNRMYKVVEHLTVCTAWKSGTCPYPDCIEVATLLQHTKTCRAYAGTAKERIAEIYRQNDPPALEKLDKQMHQCAGREEQLFHRALKKYGLGPAWCQRCAQGRRLIKVHTRHCDNKNCKVPGCVEVRTAKAERENNANAAEKLAAKRAQYAADHVALWMPLCCIVVHRRSPIGRVQVAIGSCFGDCAAKYAPDTSQQGTSRETQAVFGCLSFTVMAVALIYLFHQE